MTKFMIIYLGATIFMGLALCGIVIAEIIEVLIK